MGMKIGLRSHNGAEDRLHYAQQIGADGASIWAWAVPEYLERHYLTTDDMRLMRRRFEKYDLALTGVGIGGQVVKNQLLGLPEREQDMKNVARTLRAMGEAYQDKPQDAPVLIIDQRLTYWAVGGEYPSQNPGYQRLPIGRGGTVLTTFDLERDKHLLDAPCGEVSYDEAWARVCYFYEKLVPVAEEAKVRLATHPDDPPLGYYRGVHQVLNGFEGFKKLMEAFPSPYNGLLFCCGTMQEAGEDVAEMIRYFGAQNKIFYVHFRNVRGVVPKYEEVFAAEGDSNMIANFKALRDVGFDGFIVPDHIPGIVGDGEWEERGRAWHVGYFKGLIQALEA